MKRVAIQAQDFDVAGELAALEALGGGGVASFTGVVRGGDGLMALELEHYPAMTQAQVARIVEDAMARWPLLGVSVIHRVGPWSRARGSSSSALPRAIAPLRWKAAPSLSTG